MKRFIALIIVAIICCSTIFVPTFAQGSPVVKEEFLNSDKWLKLSTNKTGARYFVDMNNKPVRLFGQARSQSYASDENSIYSATGESDPLYEHYADLGCNFTRLAINAESICGGEKRTPEQIQHFIAKTVDPDVQAIIRNGMYVMLDVHMYPQPEGERTPFTLVQYARDYYLPFLVELAKIYKDEPMIAVIELWNEPYAADVSSVEGDEGDWKLQVRNYFIDAVNEIRKYDTRHVLMVSDHNAGWGAALPEMWDGYYKKLDPVYQNTCFSVHASSGQLDPIDWYKNAWEDWTTTRNICLLFGEIETEGGISTAQGIQNLCDMFSESISKGIHYSGVLWRPYGPNAEYHDVWGNSGWAEKYTTPDPIPSARYVSEAEDSLGGKKDAVMELVKEPALFGFESGTGISMKPNLKATDFYEAESSTELQRNIAYKEGTYKLIVRACGKNGYDGDFVIGYRDVDGAVHQIARFKGKNTSGARYYQEVSFTAAKKIVSFVYFGCETAKKSAIIDRLYLIGAESDNETSTRSRLNPSPINQVIDLSGKKHTIKADTPKAETEVEEENSVSKEDDSDYRNNYDDSEYEEDDDTEQVVVKSPDKTTVLRHKIINHDATALTITMFIALGVLLALGVFILVYYIVKKKKSKVVAIVDTENIEDSESVE